MNAGDNDMFCPRYLEEDEQVVITQQEGDTTITKTKNVYTKLKCSEKCALYNYRPYCISSQKGGD